MRMDEEFSVTARHRPMCWKRIFSNAPVAAPGLYRLQPPLQPLWAKA
jgi:hypothetical protein